MESLSPSFVVTGSCRTHCAAMEARGLPQSASDPVREMVCRVCRRKADDLGRNAPYRTIWLSESISDGEVQEIHSSIAGTSVQDLLQMEVHDVQVGVLALYDALITHKKMTLEFTHPEIEFFRNSVACGIIALRAVRRVLRRSHYDAFTCYSPQYSVNACATAMAEKLAVRAYFMEGGANLGERYRTLRIWDWQAHGLMNPAVGAWSLGVTWAPSDEDLDRVQAHVHQLRLGLSHSVYSPTGKDSASCRRRLGIPDGCDVLLAALSSQDEVFSAVEVGAMPRYRLADHVYSSQQAWIADLICYIKSRPATYLVIRVHPRDFPNRRESVASQQARLWSDVLVDLPANVVVDWPEMKIPIGAYFGEIKALTTGWSSTGVEALLAGIPVVTYDSLIPPFPASIHITGESVSDYHTNLDAILDAGAQVDQKDWASGILQWFAFNFCFGVIRVPGRLRDRPSLMSSNLRVLFGKAVEVLLGRGLRRVESRGRLLDDREIDLVCELLSGAGSSLYEVGVGPAIGLDASRQTAVIRQLPPVWVKVSVTHLDLGSSICAGRCLERL